MGDPFYPLPTTAPASTWEVLYQADWLWRTGLALGGGAWGVTQQRCFLPGAAVILIGHLSTHTGPATQRTKESAPSRPPTTTKGPGDHLQMYRNLTQSFPRRPAWYPRRSPGIQAALPSTINWVPSCCSSAQNNLPLIFCLACPWAHILQQTFLDCPLPD